MENTVNPQTITYTLTLLSRVSSVTKQGCSVVPSKVALCYQARLLCVVPPLGIYSASAQLLPALTDFIFQNHINITNTDNYKTNQPMTILNFMAFLPCKKLKTQSTEQRSA